MDTTIPKQGITKNDDERTNDWFQITAILSGSIAACSAAALFAWTSPSIPIIISTEYPSKISLEEASFLTVISPISAILASSLFSVLMDKIGRKKALLLMVVPQIIVWVMYMFSETILEFYISRLINGISDASLHIVLPTYIGEIATPKVRGSWGNSMQVAIYFGQLLINAVGGYCSIKVTAYVFVSLPILFFLSFSFMPESPYYLLMKEKEEGARESLKRLRVKCDVESELLDIQKAVSRQKAEPSQWKDLITNRTNRLALICACFVKAAQQFSGIAAFNVYTGYLFQQAGGQLSHATSAVIFEMILVVMSIIGSCFLDKLGRRLSMIISCSGCAVILLAVSIYFYLRDEENLEVSLLNWIPLAGLVLYVILYSIGLGIVPTMVLGELFSASIKAKAVCVVNVIFCVYVAIGTKLFQLLSENFGFYTPFLFFSVCCLTSTALSFYFVPETRGKTLEEIQQSLNGIKKDEKQVWQLRL